MKMWKFRERGETFPRVTVDLVDNCLGSRRGYFFSMMGLVGVKLYSEAEIFKNLVEIWTVRQ